MSRKDIFKDILNRDDILKHIYAKEKESGQKLDDGTREMIVRAVTGDIDVEQTELELTLRAVRGEYIINRVPSGNLAECLSWVSVTMLRDILDFIIHVIEEALPPDGYIAAVLGTRKKPKDMYNIIFKAKEIYTADLKSRKKKDLAADAYRLLSDRNIAKHLMLGMGPESRQKYDEAVKGGINCSFYAVTCGLMYVFGGKKSDGYSPLAYIVPDEMKDVWLPPPEPEIKRSDTAALYAAASANLYGAITGEELLQLIRRYDTVKDSVTVPLAAIDDTEILSAVNLRTFDDKCSFQLYSDVSSDDLYIISNAYREYLNDKFPDNDVNTFCLYDDISDKPCYFPSKSEFLRYSDSGYYEHTPEIGALRLYIKNKYGKQIAKFLRSFNKEYMTGFIQVTQDQELDSIMKDLHNLFASKSGDFEDMTDVLEERDINLGGHRVLNELFKYICAARDKTRTWYNKGNLPDNRLPYTDFPITDMEQIKMPINRPIHDTDDTSAADGTSASDRSNIAKILPMPDFFKADTHIPVKAAVKPGRNDLCPCGSGKKYKKCCGR